MRGNFLLELLLLVLQGVSGLAFILALGVYIVPEKKKFVPAWLRVSVIILFLIPVAIEAYLNYFTTIPLSYTFQSGTLMKSALTSAVANTYPYNIISFVASGANIIFGYILHKILWKNRTKND